MALHFPRNLDTWQHDFRGWHRAVALMQIESHFIPAFLAGYLNWFAPDGIIDGFEQEDEIVSGTLQEAYAIFRHATCVDHKGMELALFGGNRLRLCDEALLAKYRRKVITADVRDGVA